MPFSTTIQTFHAASCFASGGPFVHRKIIYRYFSFFSLTYSCGFSRVRVDHISELTGCAYLQTHLRTRVHNESTWNTRACNPFPDSFLYASVALINIFPHILARIFLLVSLVNRQHFFSTEYPYHFFEESLPIIYIIVLPSVPGHEQQRDTYFLFKYTDIHHGYSWTNIITRYIVSMYRIDSMPRVYLCTRWKIYIYMYIYIYYVYLNNSFYFFFYVLPFFHL